MSRIPYADEKTATPRARAALEKVGSMNIFRMMANGDALLEKYIVLANHLLFKTKLDPVLREIAILRVGVLSKASYEIHQHKMIAKQLKISDALIAGIEEGPDASVFTPLEADVMRFTDDVVNNVRPSDETFEPLRDALGTQELMELTMIISFYMLVCRFLETFDVDIEPEGSVEGLKVPPR